MKKTILALTTLLPALGAQAAPAPGLQHEAQVQLLRADLRSESRAVILRNLDLNEAESKAFWPIYDKYEFDGGKLVDQKLQLLKKFGDNYDHMTDAIADEIAQESFRIARAQQTLRESCYRKVAKALSPQKAARFLQVEAALRGAADLQALAAVPLFK